MSPICSLTRTSPETNRFVSSLPPSFSSPCSLKGRNRPSCDVLSLPVASLNAEPVWLGLQSEPYIWCVEGVDDAVNLALNRPPGVSRPERSAGLDAERIEVDHGLSGPGGIEKRVSRDGDPGTARRGCRGSALRRVDELAPLPSDVAAPEELAADYRWANHQIADWCGVWPLRSSVSTRRRHKRLEPTSGGPCPPCPRWDGQGCSPNHRLTDARMGTASSIGW